VKSLLVRVALAGTICFTVANNNFLSTGYNIIIKINMEYLYFNIQYVSYVENMKYIYHIFASSFFRIIL
jgi:hypothetical protein